MSKIITDNIECCNCSHNINYEYCICCNGKCVYCLNCITVQYVNTDGKTIKGHNTICKNYYNCNYCDNEIIIIDKTNFIDLTNNFIFDKSNDNDFIKYNNKFYHYDCFCKFLGYDYMELVCNKSLG